MRILMLTHAFYPSKGGTQRLVWNLSNELTKRGHTVSVLTSDTGSKHLQETIHGIKIRRFKKVNFFYSRPWYLTPKMFFHLLKRELRNFNIIHAFGYQNFQALVGIIIGKVFRIPMVLSPQYHPYPHVYDRTLGYLIIRLPDMLIAQCRQEYDFLSNFNSKERLSLVYNGINSKIFERDYDISTKLDNTKIVLNVGRLTDNKRLDILIKAFSMVKKKYKESKLILIGDGPLKRSLRNLAMKMGIENSVIFKSEISDSQLRKYYSSASVFVLTSEHESFGIVLVEAAANGMPIVSTKVGIAQDVIKHGTTGILCDKCNSREISDAIITIFENENYVKNAYNYRKRVWELFNMDTVISKLEKIYDNLISDNKNFS